jgi:hypothetical protein
VLKRDGVAAAIGGRSRGVRARKAEGRLSETRRIGALVSRVRSIMLPRRGGRDTFHTCRFIFPFFHSIRLAPGERLSARR